MPMALSLRGLEFVPEAADETPLEQRSGRRLVSIVVPLLNEQPTLAELYHELDEALASLEADWEVVFVDDGSTDGSYQELVRLHESHLNVRVVRLRRNFGKAAALAAGVEVASGEIVVTMDADLQDDPAEIPHLIAKIDEGFDVVSGHGRLAHRRSAPANRNIVDVSAGCRERERACRAGFVSSLRAGSSAFRR